MYIFRLLILIKTVFCANILHIAPVVSGSHHIWNRVLALGLTDKGHNVTMVSHNDEKVKPENFHIILLQEMPVFSDFSVNAESNTNAFMGIKTVYDFSMYCCENDLATQGFKILMNYPKDFKFDLIVIDVTLEHCFYPIIERFNNPPVVAVTPFLLPPVLSHTFGNPLQTAYVPHYGTQHTDRMSFKERIYNFILTYAEVLYRKYVAFPAEMKLARKYFGDDIQPFEVIERNISILLSNFDPVLSFPLDLPPNIIPVGGLHVRPAKPLPEDLKKIVENAKHGIIIFTLGSYLRSDSISDIKRTAILEAFAKLPQTILWKFESENIRNLPKNVIIRKWLPQSDILGHPNTKLFISHGGGLGTQEAMSHGVPVVAMPFYADQRSNAQRLVSRNMAKIVEYNDLTMENLYSAITEVLNNPIYSHNIKILSKRYQDRLESPLERAVFWVEYILRHGNAEHLVLAARDMPGYQAASLDVIAALLLSVFLIYSAFSFIWTCSKFIYRITFK